MMLAQTSDRAFIRWSWIGSHWDDIADAAVEHLALTGAAMLIGAVASLVLAVIALRWPRTATPILGLGGVLYTIPSLAAFALLFPFFGLDWPTAVIPLATYTLLILVRNMLTGIGSVPEDVREAARGMGYTERRLLLRVELPLALPVIIAGLRIATVTVVGLVTVTALLGDDYGGFGEFILDGFRRSIVFPTAILVGVAGSVVLAVVLDAAIYGAGLLVTPWTRRGT